MKMIKSVLTATAVILSSVPSAFAGAPATSITSASTIYGQFGCMERARNKFFALGATGITSDNSFIWGYVNDSTVGVWCRGQEAIVIASGDNATSLRDEIKKAF
jgi:hypothetical protein